jgi:hypothetical protein
VALVLAFIAVQAVSYLQSPPAAAVVKGELATDQSARLQPSQSRPSSGAELLPVAVFVPLAIAAACYLLVKRAV